MAQHHGALAQALGLGGAHIALPKHLQHRRARDAGDQAGGVAAQHNRRQHEVAQRIHKYRPVATCQRVDGEEARQTRRRLHASVEPARPSRPAQPRIEDEQQHQRQPEHRHAHANQREEAHHLIQPAIAPHRRQHAKQHARQHAQHNRRGRQFDRGRQVGAQIVEHRAAAFDRAPQVALQELADVDCVLLVSRLVQPPFGAKRRDDLRVGHGFLPEVGSHRVAGHRARDCKRNQRDADQQRHSDNQPAQNVGEYVHWVRLVAF